MEPLSKLALDSTKGVMLGPNGESCIPGAKDLEKLSRRLEIGEGKDVNDQSLLLSDDEVRNMASITVVDGNNFQISALVENVPISERTTSFFSDPVFRDLTIENPPEIEGLRIRIGDRKIDISLQEGDLLSTIGVGKLVSYGLDPALEQFLKVRFEELGIERLPGGEKSFLSAENLANRSEIKKLLSDPLGSVICMPLYRARDILSQLETEFNSLKRLHNKGKELTDKVLVARRIDYLVGSQYIPGKVTDLPLVGGISNLIFKKKLELEIENQDWGKLGEDAFMVISIAALPLAPATGGLAMLGWIGANATFGAISHGTISHLNGNSDSEALKDAGKGSLLGLVNGIAGVAVVSKLMPAISNKFAASAVSNAALGGVGGGAETAIRVIGKETDYKIAVKEIAVGTITGALGGAAIGSATHGLSVFSAKLRPDVLVDHGALSPTAKRFEDYRRSIEPMFPTDRPIHGGDIRNYSKLLDFDQFGFAQHLRETDPAFSKNLTKLGTSLAEAVAAKDQVMIVKLEKQMARNFSGYLAEAKVKAIFEPYFEKITTQKRVLGGTTIIDMVAEGAKHPIAIKGHRFVEKGGSLPIEVKAGTEKYFSSEIKSGHLLKQLAGHEEFGKGLVVTTRDVGDALMKTGRAREILKEAGSSPYRLLPPKTDLDRSIEHLLKGEFVEALEDWSKSMTRVPWERHNGLPDGAIT